MEIMAPINSPDMPPKETKEVRSSITTLKDENEFLHVEEDEVINKNNKFPLNATSEMALKRNFTKKNNSQTWKQ